jgi:hypothetical protein
MSTIRDAGISGDYIHTPLSDSQAFIRLVQIDLSGDEDIEIHCTISAHPLNDLPPYIAISYTWGDTSKKREIWVDEKRLKIGQSSWLALWQARLNRLQQPLRVWMDVLSIDQANDIEKSNFLVKPQTHKVSSSRTTIGGFLCPLWTSFYSLRKT